MLRAVAWMLAGALLAGGAYFLFLRKTIENDTPENARARAERLDPVALERKIVIYKAVIEKRSAELEEMTAPLREVDYRGLAAEQVEELKKKAGECQEILLKMRENLAAYEEVFNRGQTKDGE